jgi:hypothetical protein
MQANNSQRQPMSFWQFAWHEVKQRVSIGIPVLIIALVALRIIQPRPADWWDWIEPLISLLTLGFAFFIWLGQLRRAWEEYLPNRLTVHFYYQGREVMRCEKAHLANESDIRALGQQIGMQMAGGQMLSFLAPRVEISPPETDSTERYTHYTARFYLRELPTALSNPSEEGVFVWRPPFDNDPQWESDEEASCEP